MRPDTVVSDTRRDLRCMLADGGAASLMIGLGEQFVPAFALAIGLGEIVSGLVATIPILAGAILQMISFQAVRRLGSHRRWVVLCAIVQALSFVPLVVLALRGHGAALAVFATMAVYWGSGLGMLPAWNTWAETLVPREIRSRFFAARTRLSQVGLLGSFIVGGAALQVTQRYGDPLLAFMWFFAIAGVSRLVSARLLAAQSEPVPLGPDVRRVSPLELTRRLRQGGYPRLILYMLLVQVTAQFSGPYFTPFILQRVRYSYGAFATLIAVALAAKALVLPVLGRVAARYGTLRVLWLGGLGIVPLAALWTVSQSFPFLLFIQVSAGITWGAYELATFLLFLETIPAGERTSVLTTFNLLNAVAMVVGSVAGGALLHALGDTFNAYLTVFGLSSAARLITLVALWRLGGDLRRAVAPSAGRDDDTGVSAEMPVKTACD